MTAKMTDTAATAAIGAATRELRLPGGAHRRRPPRGDRATIPAELPRVPRRGALRRSRRTQPNDDANDASPKPGSRA